MEEETDVRPVIDDSAADSVVTGKTKCITNSEYHAMADWIDMQINDKNNFILNKYGLLIDKVLSKYPHLNENTMLSIVDARVQYYVRHRHHKVFNASLKPNTSVQSSTSATTTPNVNQSQCNRRSTNSAKTIYEKYKQLAAKGSNTSPLIELANNLRMPAMLVAKIVVGDHIQEERHKERQQRHNCSGSSNNSILNDSGGLLDDSSTRDGCVNKSVPIEITAANVDSLLSKQLMWLSSRLRLMRRVTPVEVLNQSLNSSTNSNSNSTPFTKNIHLSIHQLCTSTWLINTEPQLAYEVYKCSVVDNYYGSCIEFIKSCTGSRYEQVLKKSMTCFTTYAKSKINQQGGNSFFKTEKECRIRGLDMTPDMVLNEPIAILLSDDDSDKDCNQENIASHYVGGSDNAIRVLNWIESKAMFGGPEQLNTVMQRQLFPYWNRYGPGAVIYWFGHIIEDNEQDKNVHTGVSLKKPPATDCISVSTDNKLTRINLTESSAFKFWSKYCLLMDGFPTSSKIVMYNQKNNRQNGTKKKSSTTAETV